MGEEAYHSASVRLEKDGRWLTLRRTYGSSHVYLGIGPEDDSCDVLVELTPFDQAEVRRMLRREMSARAAQEGSNEP